MIFTEVKVFEIFYLQESDTWKDVLLSFGGVGIGFGLSEFATFTRNNRQKNRIGKSFQNEIDSLKPSLANQIKSNKAFLIEINNYNFISPTAFVYKNLDFVKNLDRLQVSEYYKKEFSEDYLKKIRSIYNNLIIIETEMERLLSFYETFTSDLGIQYELYRVNANKYSRAVADYFSENKLKTGDDLFLDKLMNLTNETFFQQKGTNDIIQFKESLHMKLFEIEFGHNNHPLYKTVSEFNQNGFDIITTILTKTSSFSNKVKTINLSLDRSYKRMYDEDAPE